MKPLRNKDYAGKRYGRLVVKQLQPTDHSHVRKAIVVCDCGTRKTVAVRHLRTGSIVSCGCYAREVAGLSQKTHGLTKSDEYRIWTNIKSRCLNPEIPGFRFYGAKGISICKRWRYSFENFLKDMGKRPSPKHSIDRIDPAGDYEPENCRWALDLEQQNNSSSNRRISWRGRNLTLAQWSRKTGIKRETIAYRLNMGWSVSRALETPVLTASGSLPAEGR